MDVNYIELNSFVRKRIKEILYFLLFLIFCGTIFSILYKIDIDFKCDKKKIINHGKFNLSNGKVKKIIKVDSNGRKVIFTDQMILNRLMTVPINDSLTRIIIPNINGYATISTNITLGYQFRVFYYWSNMLVR